MPGQPVGQVDVEIVFYGGGVSAGQQGKRAGPAEKQKDQAFQQNEPPTGPIARAHPVGEHGIEHVKYHQIIKDPYECMDNFDDGEFGGWVQDPDVCAGKFTELLPGLFRPGA